MNELEELLSYLIKCRSQVMLPSTAAQLLEELIVELVEELKEEESKEDA